jgi:hypothetical protein
MVGFSAISIEQLQEFQEASPEVGEQEASGVCEGGCHWLPALQRDACLYYFFNIYILCGSSVKNKLRL